LLKGLVRLDHHHHDDFGEYSHWRDQRMSRQLSWTGDIGHSMQEFESTFDVAVVMPTILRGGLVTAARSVYAQDFDGRIQLLIGIDNPIGSLKLLETIRGECPPPT
jgi:hypothetical protein